MGGLGRIRSQLTWLLPPFPEPLDFRLEPWRRPLICAPRGIIQVTIRARDHPGRGTMYVPGSKGRHDATRSRCASFGPSTEATR